jgi:basic membrane lipoprotein Med (substrate-binding protein (PBP1-ABC) superfamily)
MAQRRWIAFWLSLLAISFMVSSAPVAAQELPSSVCLITDVGLLFDGGFNESAYGGMERAVEEFGLESTTIETQSPSDYAANIQLCLDNEYDIIITVGFSLAEATRAAALENPETYFIGVDQDFLSQEPVANLVGIQFREDQGGFLAGAIAAMMTESGIVAGVYGDDIYPVVKFRSGFEQGARYINPEITTLGVYIENFEVPDQGAEAAAQFIGEGADVIFGAGGRTGSGGITYAAAEGTLVIGVDLDQYFTEFGGGDSPGAENIITSAIKRIDNGVYAMIAAAFNGEGFPANSTYVLEIANDGIDFAPTHDADVPEEVIERLTDIREGLREGQIVTGVDPVTGDLLPDLFTLAGETENLSILAQVISALNMNDMLMTTGPFTVFAPSDAAFEAYFNETGTTLEDLIADSGRATTSLIQYHTLEGGLTASLLLPRVGAEVFALNGAPVTLALDDDMLTINEVPVAQADLLASNGVIHIIDSVLIPPEG